MIKIFLFLSYYDFNTSEDSHSYFHDFKFLKYGFKKNANYIINFSSTPKCMVFGLATNKEIKKIKKFKDDQQYCSGLFEMSKIQYFVCNGSVVLGEISSSTILTPYAFTCETSYSLTSRFEYYNGPNHLDYRLQIFRYFTFIHLLLTMLLTIIFFIYFIYKSCHYECNIDLILTFFVIFFYSFVLMNIQIFILNCYLETRKNDEYFNFIDEFSRKYEIKQNQGITAVVFHVVTLIIYYTIGFVILNYQISNKCIKIFIGIVLYTLILLHLIFQIIFGKYILSAIFLAIIIILNIIFTIRVPILLISTLCYSLGSFLAFPIGEMLIFKMHHKISDHMLFMILAIIFSIGQFTSFVLFFIQLIVCINNSDNDDKFSIKEIIVLSVNSSSIIQINSHSLIVQRKTQYTIFSTINKN